MICPKCGSENAPDDAFCGSCGAFLEFAAEEAAEAGGVPGPAPAEATLPAPAPGVIVSATPTAEAGAAPSAHASPGSQAKGPACAACGRENPAGRTFCVSCGARLPAPGAGAAPVAVPAPAAAAKATSPARPAWDFPTAPVPPAGPTTAAPPGGATPATPAGGAGATSGGRSRLPLALAAVGAVILGVGALLALGGALGGGAPDGTPTAVPSDVAASLEPSPEASASPAETLPPAATAAPAATPAPTPAPTIPAGPSVGIKVTSAKASSQLKTTVGPRYLLDGSPATTWKSATGEFAGAWVEVRFAPAAITRIQVWTGWQRSEPLFYGNHRPQNVTVSFDGGDPVPLRLQDILGAQRIDIPAELGIVRATRVRITIADVYPARTTTAKGSPTKEVAISEIRLFGIPVTP